MRERVISPRLALVALTLAAAVLCTTTGCADAYADGQRLGEQHVALLHAEQLTLPRLSSEFEAGRAAHRSHQAQLDFSEGYAASIAPVRAQLAALARDHAARTSARALIDGLEALGEDLGHAAGGLLAQLKAASSSRTPELREVGRSLGQVIRTVEGGARSFMDGVDEGLRDVPAPKPAP